MAQLQFEITHQIIKRIDNFEVVSDSVNYLYAHFDFKTDEWSGTKTAIFKNGEQAYEMILDSSDECLVPHEVLSEDGKYISVSVFSGELVTANVAKVFVIRSGYTDDLESSQPPTPSVYQQILDKLNNIDGGTFDD